MIHYDFAREFAKVPGPREERIGPNSGERFRIEVLEPLFDANTPIEIDISGTTLSFGPSFLSEAFGELVGSVGKDRFYEIIHFKDDTLKNIKFRHLVEKYVDLAIKKRSK